jgi:hypothetical protein
MAHLSRPQIRERYSDYTSAVLDFGHHVPPLPKEEFVDRVQRRYPKNSSLPTDNKAEWIFVHRGLTALTLRGLRKIIGEKIGIENTPSPPSFTVHSEKIKGIVGRIRWRRRAFYPHPTDGQIAKLAQVLPMPKKRSKSVRPKVMPDFEAFKQLVQGHESALTGAERKKVWRMDPLREFRGKLNHVTRIGMDKIDALALRIAHEYSLEGKGNVGIAMYLALRGIPQAQLRGLFGMKRAAISVMIARERVNFKKTLTDRVMKKAKR